MYILGSESLEVTGTNSVSHNLAVIIFENKRQAVVKEQNNNTEIVLKISLNENEEDMLNQVFETIQQVKQIYDFSNLDSFFSTLSKNLNLSEDVTQEKLNDIHFIEEFLQMFILSNFFKPDEKHSKKLVLNFKDHSFVERFNMILSSVMIEKLSFLNLKPLLIVSNQIQQE